MTIAELNAIDIDSQDILVLKVSLTQFLKLLFAGDYKFPADL